jgi:hypothetical protein
VGLDFLRVIDRCMPKPGSGAGYKAGEYVFPCGQTMANAVFFRIGAMAYNLYRLFLLKVLDASAQASGSDRALASFPDGRQGGRPCQSGVFEGLLRPACPIGITL